MSDSEKLRRTTGNLWLALSFFLFTLAVCGIWSIFVFSWGLAVTLIGILPTIFILMSICISYGAYDTFIVVDNSEINKSDSAKLRRIDGIFELIGAYIFLALSISDIWVFFAFAEIVSSFWSIFIIALAVFVGAFYGFVIVAVNNFMAIDRCVKGKNIKSKHRGGLLTVHSSPSSIIPPPSKK